MPLDKQDKVDLKVGAEVRYTLATDGWSHIERILRQRIREMEEEVLRPYSVARTRDGGLSREDHQEVVAEKKGALMGLRLALDMPRAIVANAEDILKRVPADQQDEALAES